MATVSLELPADLVAQLKHGGASQEAARLLALELFRLERVSLGRAAELCSMPLADFMEFAAQRGIPPLNYGLEQLEEDRRTMEILGL